MTVALTPSEFGGALAGGDGATVLTAGTTERGTGPETAYAQLASRVLGVPMDRIRVVQSDTGLVARGSGTSGSRSLQVGGSAVRAACVLLVDRAKQEAARRLEASAEDIVQLDDGRFGVQGVPATALSWADPAADAA